jgi:uncharacterized protein
LTREPVPRNCAETIFAVLASFPAVESATLFGSRAKGTHKDYSDIDIAVFGDLSFLDVERLIADLDEQPTMFKFDVVSYHQLKNKRLKDHIDRVGIPIYSRSITENKVV